MSIERIEITVKSGRMLRKVLFVKPEKIKEVLEDKETLLSEVIKEMKTGR